MFITKSPTRPPLTRRDFLKFGAVSLPAVLFSPAGLLRQVSADQQGRVLVRKILIYDIPSFSGKEVNTYWMDNILPITGVTVGDDPEAYNRIWYKIGSEGYAYSGSIQPVRTVLNDPVSAIPPGGTLAEVTVPFTDSYYGPGKEFDFAYRYYYETTYWVSALVEDSNGNPWYRILEDKWDDIFYVPASHLRLVPPSELEPLSPWVPPFAKHIVINLTGQSITAYEWEKPVFMARVATGAQLSNGDFSTPAGKFMIYHKRPSRHMAAGNLALNGYDLPGVPWVSYFTEDGISLHGTYWHNDFGRPRSHGCVNLAPQAAKWLFRWTVPVVPPDQQRAYEPYGTYIDIYEE